VTQFGGGSEMNLYLSLNKAITLWPKNEALVDGDKRFTYEQFGKECSAANYMLASGLHKVRLSEFSLPIVMKSWRFTMLAPLQA